MAAALPQPDTTPRAAAPPWRRPGAAFSGYDPGQPRDPAGTSTGGQWSGGTGGRGYDLPPLPARRGSGYYRRVRRANAFESRLIGHYLPISERLSRLKDFLPADDYFRLREAYDNLAARNQRHLNYLERNTAPDVVGVRLAEAKRLAKSALRLRIDQLQAGRPKAARALQDIARYARRAAGLLQKRLAAAYAHADKKAGGGAAAFARKGADGAAEKGQQSQGGQRQHQDAQEGRPQAVAGGGDRAQEGGQVPQEEVAAPVAFFAWDESKHPRGQPENKGEFAPAGGGGAGDKSPPSGGIKAGDTAHAKETLYVPVAGLEHSTKEVFAHAGEPLTVVAVGANGMVEVKNAAGRMAAHPPGLFREFRAGGGESAPAYERVKPGSIDSPTQAVLNDARKQKQETTKRAKELRQEIKDAPLGGARSRLRFELIKVQDAHAKAVALEQQALDALERRANELGRTTRVARFAAEAPASFTPWAQGGAA